MHVAVPDPELAVRAFNGMRAHIPVLLALAANSPVHARARQRARLAPARRSSRPSRAPASRARSRTYAEYAEAIDALIRCGAIPEPTFIWWDVRLQPKLGTLEVRVMDAQTRIRDTAALVALVQCLVRLEALDGMAEPELRDAPEVLDENRFLAARDGIHAQLLDPRRDRCVPASGRLATLVDACWPHARALGLRARAGAARPPRRRPGRRAPARDRLRAARASAASCTSSRPSSRRRARSCWPRLPSDVRSTRVGPLSTPGRLEAGPSDRLL